MADNNKKASLENKGKGRSSRGGSTHKSKSKKTTGSTSKNRSSSNKESADHKKSLLSKKGKGSGKQDKSNLRPLSKAERKAAKKKLRPRWTRWLRKLVFVGLILTAAGVLTGVIVFAYFAKDLPDASQLENRVIAESTKIYDSSGEHLLYETGKDVRRTYTKLEDMTEDMAEATVALEDKNFYNHHGFDPVGILRSAGINISSNKTVGGSTITQQFVKLAIVGSEKTYSRKIKELILSIELERQYDKDQILEFYLNEASYGGVNLGVAAASRSYFDKNPDELSLAESALLASIPQRPTYYISTDREALYKRKDFALDRMVEEGYITEDEAAVAKLEEVEIQQVSAYKYAPHFVDYVIGQLEDDFGGGFINQGLKVTTTLDYGKQELAEETIDENISNIESRGGSNAALVSIDTHTGQVLAMVGSKDYYDENYDGQVNVATSLRQPGSSFKPIVYVTAFANGYSPNTILFDVKTNFPTDTVNYSPNNYSGGFAGPVSIRHSLAQSLNIPAVKTLYLVGTEKALDTADALGYSSLKERDRYGLSLVLGGGEVTLLEHTSAFATFAREGERHPLATILKVEDQSGNTLYEWTDSTSQVVDKAAVQTLNNVLSDSGARAGFNALNVSGHTIAAKTGTTNDYRDAWTMGYTPSFATGVWVGNNDNSEMNQGAAGLVVAAPIMSSYMSKILKNTPDESFNTPPPSQANKPPLYGKSGETVEKYVDKDTGLIIPDECLDKYPEEYKQKREFKEAHSILHYVNKEDPLGVGPGENNTDPAYTQWEAAVQLWAQGQEEYVSEETEYEDCNLRSADQTPTVTILNPGERDRVTADTFDIQISVDAGNERSIKKVEYIIDSVTVDVKTGSAYDSTYDASTLTAGNHTLTVKVTNDRDNIDEATTAFTFSARDSSTNTNKNSNSNSNKNKNSNSNNKNTNKNTNKNSNRGN